MTNHPPPQFNIIKNGAVDILRMADIHRRASVVLQQQSFIGQFNKLSLHLGVQLLPLLSQDNLFRIRSDKKDAAYGKTVTMSFQASVADIIPGQPEKVYVDVNVTQADQSEMRQQIRQLAKGMRDMMGYAESKGIEKVILPFVENTKSSKLCAQAIREYKLPEDFFGFMDEPYDYDLSIYGPIDPRVTQNILHTSPKVFATMIHIWHINDDLKQKWCDDMNLILARVEPSVSPS